MSNGVEQQVAPATPADLIPLAAGVTLFAWWLLSTSLGRTALDDSRPRRNSMGPLLPFMVFFVWIVTQELLTVLVVPLARRLDESQASFLIASTGALSSLAVVALVLAVARMTFARGIKGFGLRIRTLPQDFPRAFLTLMAVWPLVMAMMSLTVLVMKHVKKDFEVPQHDALQLITESASLPLVVLVIALAVVVAPILEEMLFRGLFQTMIRSHLGRPWPAIAMTSILFAMIHKNAEHWPALFILAMGLGYSYEKNGSLLRAILMHAMFNGITIAAALLEAATRPSGIT